MSVSRILTSLTTLIVFLISNILPVFLIGFGTSDTFAAYTESTANTFAAYKKEIMDIGESIEAEFRVNGSISTSTLQSAKNLVKSAYDRLPDRDDFGIKNKSAFNGVNLALDQAIKNPTSQTYVSNAVGALSTFISEASIQQITGSITANPSSGNAPLTVSFLATSVVDPS